MKLEIWKDGNKENEIIEGAKQRFLEALYGQTIQKRKDVKVKYKYNYTDKQTIDFIYTWEDYNGTKRKVIYRFVDVPTQQGFLDTSRI